MGNVVIIHGVPSSDLSRGSEKALDSETLLVFDDRKVLGYVYETFGPTAQPLYQVKFNSTTFPLNPELVIPGREVFHVPARSKFVFVNQIKAFKGSDASNVHDEEVGDDEIEFSDDEKEAEYKSRLKRKRADSRACSQAGSRQATPNATLMRDQELNGAGIAEEFLSRNAYDEHGPYDIDYTAPGPSSAGSRPLPGPYDDPYGDPYAVGNARSMDVDSDSQPHERREEKPHGQQRQVQRGRGRGKDRERHNPHGAQGHGQTHRGRGRGGGQMHQRQGHGDSYRAQNHNQGGTDYGHHPPQHQQMAHSAYGVPPYGGAPPWGYNQHVPQGYDYATGYSPQGQGQYPFAPMQNPMGMGMGFPPQGFPVQPHINPRFASAFGMPMGYPGAGVPNALGPPGVAATGINMNGSPMPGQVPTPVQTQLQPHLQHQTHSQPPTPVQNLPQNALQSLLGQTANQNQSQLENQNQQQLSFDVDSLLKSVAAASAAAAASQGSSGPGDSGVRSGGNFKIIILCLAYLH
ncbi:Gar1/Naf1 RNA binding region-domain-containing protein [Panaeolus papilionaceus]|nr:Gar1/Naf1 RNA binding region-domain-containing protein [Panaeolus papilionaceus]